MRQRTIDPRTLRVIDPFTNPEYRARYREALDRLERDGGLTLSAAAMRLGLSLPMSEADLRELARACLLNDVRTNLDGEPGAWRTLREEEAAKLRACGCAVACDCLDVSGHLAGGAR